MHSICIVLIASVCFFACVSAQPTVISWPNGFINIPSPTIYEYGPSIILENGVFYAFFCAPGDIPNGWDSIKVIQSKDGFTWSAPIDALEEQNGYDTNSVCDPSVVKFNGVYFMYHTCINTANPPDGYQNNRICVATSDLITGPYYSLQKPVIQDLACSPHDTTMYCVGQPSALSHNGSVYVYFTEVNSTNLPGPNQGYIYLATSSDGIDFTWQNNYQPVFTQRDIDIKFDRSTQLFFFVQGDVGDSHITWSASSDGINFIPYNLANSLASNPDLPQGGTNNNPGLAGESDGSFSGTTFALYGSSYQVGWGTWHLYRTDFVINPAQNNCTACCTTSCDLACSSAGTTSQGTCASPGSENPLVCCACNSPPVLPDCGACAPEGCVTGCRGAGYGMGICGVPGGTNPSDCCTCWDDNRS